MSKGFARDRSNVIARRNKAGTKGGDKQGAGASGKGTGRKGSKKQ